MMEFNRELFGLDIRVQASMLNITYTEAAKEAGISKATFSRCANAFFVPSIEVFGKLCFWLGKSPEYYFTNK